MAIDISKSAIPLFQSPDRLELLDDIDKFRRVGLNNVPKIVVCGDTSSGKSSVLEALSGIPFPVDSTMCTRCATEIALRHRSSSQTVSGWAFIKPRSGSSDEHRARIMSFEKQITASLDEIPDVLREAQEAMGLGEAGGIGRDILHLSLQGPQLPNLTLVDLPGLIHSAPSSDDIVNVQGLVEGYLRQKESLIMAIVSAENPIEKQGILTLCRKFDPAGERTIGVITKPDILQRPDKARLTPTILELAGNQHATFKFKRDWQIVRCLTDGERQTGANRDRIETELFFQDPWYGFNRKRLGTKSLRDVLCEYLEEHILHELPELIKSLEGKITSVKLSLQELGPHRATKDEQRQYLIRISRRYAQIVRDALNGDYSDSFFAGPDDGKRLRATTMALTDDFEHAMRTRGHAFEVVDDASTRSTAPDEPQRITMAEALDKVERLMEGCRGPELPILFNPRSVAEVFKEQSQKWPQLSTEYTEAVCHAVDIFLRKAVDSICPVAAPVGKLIRREVLHDAIHEHRERLNNKVLELFAPHTGSFLYSTKSRLRVSLITVRNEDDMSEDDSDAASDDRIFSLGEDRRLRALQLSRAYYNVALETFIVNVVVLGVESCLLSKLEEMFSPETVAQMSEDQLQLLAGENPEMIAERAELVARLETLEMALRNCRRYASRGFGLDLDRARGTTPGPVSESLRSGSRNDGQSVSLPPKSSNVNKTTVLESVAPAASPGTRHPQTTSIDLAATPKPLPLSSGKVGFGSKTSGISDAEDKSSLCWNSPVPHSKDAHPPAPKVPSNAAATDTSNSSKPLFGGLSGPPAAQSIKPNLFGNPSVGSNVAPSSSIFGSSGTLGSDAAKPASAPFFSGAGTDGGLFGAPAKHEIVGFGNGGFAAKPASTGTSTFSFGSRE
ncbi:Dynamin central domain-containing protein isoform 3 [Cladophialophora immunda]|nr:Dynamin central domain-containing protein isoform 1 [Cladophialophora immunda]OQU97027.1 Dynamin central domain-containing protein isoform 3 [Cladophialophora immunda]